jgi:hypothetical protein
MPLSSPSSGRTKKALGRVRTARAGDFAQRLPRNQERGGNAVHRLFKFEITFGPANHAVREFVCQLV